MNKYVLFIVSILLITSCSPKRQKDFDPLSSSGIAVVFDGVVNIRKNPGIESKVVAQIKEGDRVHILARTGKREQIEKYFDEWIKVKLVHGKTGYLFAAFIFEVDRLFKDEYWNYLTYSEWAFGIKFKKNGKLIAVYATQNSFSRIKSDFSIKKDYVKINNDKINFLPDKLYFFRYKGENYLCKTDLKVNARFKNVIDQNMTLWSTKYKGMKKFLQAVKNKAN